MQLEADCGRYPQGIRALRTAVLKLIAYLMTPPQLSTNLH